MTRTRHQSGLTLNAAHPFTLVWPEIELAVIGQRQEIGLLEGNTGPVQIDLATNTPDPGSDRTVDIKRIARHRELSWNGHPMQADFGGSG